MKRRILWGLGLLSGGGFLVWLGLCYWPPSWLARAMEHELPAILALLAPEVTGAERRDFEMHYQEVMAALRQKGWREAYAAKVRYRDAITVRLYQLQEKGCITAEDVREYIQAIQAMRAGTYVEMPY